MRVKKYLLLLAVFLYHLPFLGQEINVMTYNIKYDNTNDSVNNWNDRKAAMVALLKKKEPDFIGMQEVLYRQLRYLDEALPDHKYVGVARDDGKHKGEFSPILYNTNDYILLDSNTFWLSKTPDEVSVGWDAAMERICTYGFFQNKSTHEKFWVFNTHFDHIGVKARKKSTKLILNKIKRLNKEKHPLILMGDLNLVPEEKPILFLQRKLDDGQIISKTAVVGPKGTFNGFDPNDPMLRRIDYIFTQGFAVARYGHINERLTSGKHISDHLPVVAAISKK